MSLFSGSSRGSGAGDGRVARPGAVRRRMPHGCDHVLIQPISTALAEWLGCRGCKEAGGGWAAVQGAPGRALVKETKCQDN